MKQEWQHASAWRGTELFEKPDWTYRFVDADVAELAAALEGCRGLPLEQLNPTTFPLPRLAAFFAAMGDGLEQGCGARYLRGFPVSRFEEDDLRRIFWGICRHLGTPISQSALGERIFSVRDEGFKIGHPKARGPNTSKALRFHTDRCDVIAFMCLKQAAEGGRNYLISSKTLYNEIAKRRPDLLEALHQPYTYLRHVVDTGNSMPYTLQPVFAEHEGIFVANLLRVLINRAQQTEGVPKLSSLQVEALDFLETVAAEPDLHVHFRQEPGDMLFVNNWVLLHSRDAFADAGQSTDRRHLLRVWLSMPNSRALPEAFRGMYGQVGAGAIRGGMKPQAKR